MNIAKRLLAFAIGIAALYGWWRTNGLSGYVYDLFHISKRSPMLDQFVGFLSIFAMIGIILCFMAVAAVCIGYAVNPTLFKDDGKEDEQPPFKLMLKERALGILFVAVGLVIWFLAYQLPEYGIDWLYRSGIRSGFRGGLQGALCMLLGLCMLAGACGGILITACGAGMAFCPAKVLKKN